MNAKKGGRYHVNYVYAYKVMGDAGKFQWMEEIFQV